MRTNKAQRYARFVEMMGTLGFTADETAALLKAERALHRWSEMECGTGDDRTTVSIERDDETDKPYRRVQYMAAGGKWIDRREPVRDMERAAMRRIDSIVTPKPGLSFYYQGDPRGCALYVLRAGDVPAGEDVNAYYSRGIPVCVD
jgi:predicted DNA-binding transcriptional regulator YafY